MPCPYCEHCYGSGRKQTEGSDCNGSYETWHLSIKVVPLKHNFSRMLLVKKATKQTKWWEASLMMLQPPGKQEVSSVFPTKIPASKVGECGERYRFWMGAYEERCCLLIMHHFYWWQIVLLCSVWEHYCLWRATIWNFRCFFLRTLFWEDHNRSSSVDCTTTTFIQR